MEGAVIARFPSRAFLALGKALLRFVRPGPGSKTRDRNSSA
jgi:hypothetical protein